MRKQNRVKKTVTLALAGTVIVGVSAAYGFSAMGASDDQEETAAASESTASEGAAGSSGSEDMVLELKFGYDTEVVYTADLYDNETAVELYRALGDSNYNLPIYHYDDFDQADVIQYYDIPSSYDIPLDDDALEEVTEVHAGELYYSDPNRIILVYRDTTLEGEYVPIGELDITDYEEFEDQVENNPVLDFWECTVVPVHREGGEFTR